MRFLRLNGTTHDDRNSVIADLSTAISSGGGWIIDHRLYSDLSVCLIFQVEGDTLGQLWEQLAALPIRFSEASVSAVADLLRESETGDAITGTLEVTFCGGTGDLHRRVPSVPG